MQSILYNLSDLTASVRHHAWQRLGMDTHNYLPQVGGTLSGAAIIQEMLPNHPLMLIVEADATLNGIHFTGDSVPTRQPLLLGATSASCGIYQPTSQGLAFAKQPHLNDTLSRALSVQLLQEFQQQGTALPYDAYYLAVALVNHLVCKQRAHQQVVHPIREKLTPYCLKQIDCYVHSHLEQTIQIKVLAAIAGISVYHFIRSFKHCTGETPYRYVSRMKIEAAKKLMQQSDDNITQIGFAVGFEDPSHFAKVFKKFSGYTPRQYRRLVSVAGHNNI